MIEDRSANHSPTAHSHDHKHNEEEDDVEIEKQKRKKVFHSILKSTILMALLTIGEFIGGAISNSIAIISDAAHLSADVLSFIATLVFLKMSDRLASDKYTYGFKRTEVLGSLTTMTALWIIAGVICYESSVRMSNVINEPNNTVVVDGMIMCVTALAATVCNVLIFAFVKPPEGHGHSHGDVNQINIFIHTLSHMINSVGMIVAGALIWAYPANKLWWMQLADPIVSISSNIIGLIPTISVIKSNVEILMQKFPHEFSRDAVITKLKEIPGIDSVHALHVWELTEGHMVATVHIQIFNEYDQMIILEKCHEALTSFGVQYTTVQIEFPSHGHHRHIVS